MSTTVLLAVLTGALLHASWNAVVKAGRDAAMNTILVTSAAGVVSAAALAFVPAPRAASWPFALASAAIHVAYFALLAAAYHAGDLSLVYPLVRGSAPLLVTVGAVAFGGERPGPATWVGVLLVSGGILGLALDQGRAARHVATSAGLALANAVVVAAYTLVDALGVRRSGSPLAYTAWVFLLTAIPLATWAGLAQRPRLVAQLAATWRAALFGGGCTLASYALALWAMTRAPVAAVAALRETSIAFGMALAAVWLRERLGPARLAAATAIAAGAMALRLAP